MLFSGQQGTISRSQAQLLTTKTISPTNISQNVHKLSKKCRQKQKTTPKNVSKTSTNIFYDILVELSKDLWRIFSVWYNTGREFRVFSANYIVKNEKLWPTTKV